MTRAIILALALTVAVIAVCLAYTAGIVEGVTHRHTPDQSASISR